MQEELANIAARIRELREISGISAENAAREINLPLDSYQQYEQGETDIPIGILYQLAQLFNVELTSLLTGEEPRLHIYTIVRKHTGIAVERRQGYSHHSLASNFAHKKAEPFLVTVQPAPADAIPPTNSHPGQEFDYLIQGKLKIIIGAHELILEAGDSIYFDASYSHGMVAIGDEPAQFLAIII